MILRFTQKQFRRPRKRLVFFPNQIKMYAVIQSKRYKTKIPAPRRIGVLINSDHISDPFFYHQGNPDQIRENNELYHFSLTDEEMQRINALDRNEKHDWY